MAYRPGDLNQWVTFRKKVATPDGMGGNTVTDQDVRRVRALVRPMTGTEREHAHRLNVQANYLFVIRPCSDIDETCYAVWNGATFNLRFIKLRPRSVYLEIEAEKGVPE